MQNSKGGLELPARTHAEAMVHFRRPFAPGAIGFRAMMRAPYNDDPLRRRPRRRLHQRPVGRATAQRGRAGTLAPGVPAGQGGRPARASAT